MVAYSGKAQPYLDAIADSFFNCDVFRNWVLEGTRAFGPYSNAKILSEEQKAIRWAGKPTKQPYWANYWCGRDRACTCRLEGSKSLESDAIFFLQNETGRTLAVHIEFKHAFEPFSYGQAEAYPLRAACFVKTHTQRRTLNAHHDWTSVLFCGDEALLDSRLQHFDKVVLHSAAKKMIRAWPQ